MQLEQDTIVAIATSPGRGGIGIVRLSGAEARQIAASLCTLRGQIAAGRARFAEIVDEAGFVLDEAVVTYFAAPPWQRCRLLRALNRRPRSLSIRSRNSPYRLGSICSSWSLLA